MPLSWAPQPSGHLPSLPLTSLELDRSKLNSLSFLPPAHHPHSPFPRLTLPLRSLSWWMLTTIPSISLDRKILNSFSPASLTCSQSPSPDSYCFFLLFYHSFYCHHPCPSHLTSSTRPTPASSQLLPSLPLLTHFIPLATTRVSFRKAWHTCFNAFSNLSGNPVSFTWLIPCQLFSICQSLPPEKC